MYDYIIVGAGVAGAVAARLLADSGKKVLIIEKRNHIGGNCYDLYDENGVLIHEYGPHIFHTNSERVYEFLSKYTKWYDYHHVVKAYIDGKYVSVPFNIDSIRSTYDEEKAQRIIGRLIKDYGEGQKVAILELMDNSDEEIKELANFVYNNVFLHYTMKQWGKKPEEIDKSVTARVPVLISEDDGYFQDKYQGMPLDGYTKMFENILDSENIEVRLNTDALELLTINDMDILFEGERYQGQVIYTGPIDELYSCKYGRLPYRTLDFVFEKYENCESYQPAAVVNYTVSEKFTRISEFKKLTGQDTKNSTIVKEYPKEYNGSEGQIPYYSIVNDKNLELYGKYKNEADKHANLHMLGRLAEYKYYNIDAIALEAMKLVEEFLKTY